MSHDCSPYSASQVSWPSTKTTITPALRLGRAAGPELSPLQVGQGSAVLLGVGRVGELAVPMSMFKSRLEVATTALSCSGLMLSSI